MMNKESTETRNKESNNTVTMKRGKKLMMRIVLFIFLPFRE